jgi:hypothetical protein
LPSIRRKYIELLEVGVALDLRDQSKADAHPARGGKPEGLARDR